MFGETVFTLSDQFATKHDVKQPGVIEVIKIIQLAPIIFAECAAFYRNAQFGLKTSNFPRRQKSSHLCRRGFLTASERGVSLSARVLWGQQQRTG